MYAQRLRLGTDRQTDRQTDKKTRHSQRSRKKYASGSYPERKDHMNQSAVNHCRVGLIINGY